MGEDYSPCCADERWLPVADHEGAYEISSCGRVRSIDRWQTNVLGRRRFWPGQVLRPGNAKGYPLATLSAGPSSGQRTIHSMVLTAFVGQRPDGLLCCHGDGSTTNNHVWNLRWDTHAANSADMLIHGTNFGRSKTACPRGHLLVPPNLRLYPRRSCKVCARARALARRRDGSFDWRADADRRYREMGFTAA